jgi:hypothetical protein
MIQLIVEVDEGMSASALPAEAQKKIADLGIQWNESTVIGTQAVEGKKLILLLSTIGGDELQEIMNEPFVIGQDDEGENIVEWFDLDWYVVAEEGILIDQSLLLPYFKDKTTIEINEDGEETTEQETITDLNGIIQTYSGHKWMH